MWFSLSIKSATWTSPSPGPLKKFRVFSGSFSYKICVRVSIARVSSSRASLSLSFVFKVNLLEYLYGIVEPVELDKMMNEEGQNMDLYIPRKCSATNRLITSKDHASVQLNVGHVDENGVYTGQFTTFALCGFVRAQGDADSAVDRLWQKKKTEVKQQ